MPRPISHRRLLASLWCLLPVLLMLVAAPSALAQGREPGGFRLGEALYQRHCAVCHDDPKDRTPGRAGLSRLRASEILSATTDGIMRGQAQSLTPQQLQAIASYLTAKPSPDTNAPKLSAASMGARCGTPATTTIDLDRAAWRGWGNDLRNTRHQAAPGLKPEDVPRLKPRWVYAFDASMTVGQPVMFDGRLFVGSQSGEVISLDAKSGCTHWTRRFPAPVRTAISLARLPEAHGGRIAAFFGDDRGWVHAVDAMSGDVLWSRKLDEHVAARITGAPALHEGRLYVPVSSGEEGWAQQPSYTCCTFRGSVVALDIATGQTVWRTYTLDVPASPYRRNRIGTQQFGPAGAAVWVSPTIDTKRGQLYIGTGNSYTDVEEGRSDAILAIELASGRLRWVNQITPGDNYVMPCTRPGLAGTGNCPQALGPDFDFGSSPILSSLPDGRELLLVGQKSGYLYALDPDSGQRVWEIAVGAGSALGGIQWGMAADADTLYVPVADPYRRAGGPPPQPGVYAVKIADGRLRWSWPAPAPVCAWGTRRCLASNSAATTVIPGVVFAGAADGHLRAHRSSDGQVIWDFDTAAEVYAAVNGGHATGGSIDNGGPIVVDGMVFVNSGYGRQLARAGNALFAFSVDGK